MIERHETALYPAGIPSDLLYLRYAAAERHDRLAAAAAFRRLRRRCRG